jgi:gluconokinase
VTAEKIIVMGVSGCGKSLVGSRLARALALPFFDADDFHSQANINKMSSGIALTDTDRTEWLEDLAALLRREPKLVLACSALKKRYRDHFRQAVPGLTFVYLQGDQDTIAARLIHRENHYFQGKYMLESQFSQLDEPSENEALVVSVLQPVGSVLEDCLTGLQAGTP